MQKRWRKNISRTKANIDKISREAGVNKFILEILANRGIDTLDAVDRFLTPKLKHLHSPKHLKDMDKGTELVLKAIKAGKKIVIYGDYDCDGVTSTTIMYKGLKRCGANVSYHIPHRIEEGYGMNSEAVKRLSEEGFEVIITCDNGISAVEQVDLAKSLGMEVVVTDHHEVPFLEENGVKRRILPNADAIINPKQEDCEYPFKHLCGAGVAFKFIHTLYVKSGVDSKELFELIEIAAIGTVCDVVDLVDENRILVSMGLKMINETKNKGLKALIKEVGLNEKRVRAGNLGFQIGPCINATGRLDTASLSVELLLCEDEKRAEELARELRSLNLERQALTDDALEEVIGIIENTGIKKDKVLVVYKPDLHESLAGILAGRVRERYNKPAYVITEAKGKAKGSGRSIEEYDMFEEISKCKDILLGAGGHPMAAGFSLVEENIPLFRKRLNEQCTLTEEDLICKVDIDDELEVKDISFDLIDSLEKLEPFGKGNKEPLFMVENVYIDRISMMGQNKEHIKLVCRDSKTGTVIHAVAFQGTSALKEKLSEAYGEDMVDEAILDPQAAGLSMDLLFKPSVNEWNNTKSVQMRLEDYRVRVDDLFM
jgi:single-stranded-DNA-specific exonuclease